MIDFNPSIDVAVVIHTLLDRYERCAISRYPNKGDGLDARATPSIRLDLADINLPTYFSQLDPEPRLVANHQLQTLESLGLLDLTWLLGERGHLLESVALRLERVEALYQLMERTSLADLRARLVDLLLGERFRFQKNGPTDWRGRVVEDSLEALRCGKSPTPFKLTDSEFNQDLLLALAALDDCHQETPYRVFSVRVFNDSKRFDELKRALVVLARRGNPYWRRTAPVEVLRELGLVANPTYLYLSGPWELVDADGQALSLGGFSPSVGLPAAQVANLQRARIHASAVLCIENATTFHEVSRARRQVSSDVGGRNRHNSQFAFHNSQLALLCLWGNPSPACRHLLCCLNKSLPGEIPLLLWADLDYGGFRILAHLRREVSDRFQPYNMDVETMVAHAALARPLSRVDRRNLERLASRSELADMHPVIDFMLARGLKLEQEAVQ